MSKWLTENISGEMMTKWIQCKIKDIGTVVGGATPSTKNSSYYGGDIPWLTPKDLSDYHNRYITRGERNITLSGLNSCSAQLLPKNTILFTSRAPIGYIAIAANPIATNQGFKSIIPKENIDPLFLYYLLKNNVKFIESQGSGTTFKEISGSVMKEIELNIPDSMEDQKKISSILSCLDEAIELNNRINDNLMEQIQNLYDSWFKKYEPFKETTFIDSEFGEIPKDWRIANIYEISSIIYGAPFSSKLFNTDKKGKPLIRIRDLKTQSSDTYTTENHPKGYLIQSGDIVVGMDGEFSPYIWGNEEGWLNQRLCVFSNKRPKGKAFLFCSIKPLLKQIEKTEIATTVIHIGKADFDDFQIILPPQEILQDFDKLTSPIIDLYVQILNENRTLNYLRNTLIPKLMSEEIDVSEVKLTNYH